MLAVLESTWRAVQTELRGKIGEAAFDAWLAELRPLAMERGVVHFEAKNRLVCERVDRLYRDDLVAALTQGFGTTVDVEIQPAPESLLPDALEVGPTQPVVDASNRTAMLVLQALLEDKPLPSRLFLFHGAAGTGKSFLLDWWRHLWRARRPQTDAGDRGSRRGPRRLDPAESSLFRELPDGGEAMRRARPDVRSGPPVLHFDGRGLVAVVQAAMRDRRSVGLREELTRDVPLIIDELHRISGCGRTQAELTRVLEARSASGAVTLLASRWHPREIWELADGLRTWLLSGFVVRVDPPGPTARLTYLRALEGARSRNGRGPAIEELARRAGGGGYPDLRRAWAVERAGVTPPVGSGSGFRLIEPKSTFERLRDRVAEQLEVPVDDLLGQTQRRRASLARKVLAWLCVQEGLSRAEVGRYLGQRTRAAISYAIKSLEAAMAEDDELRAMVEGLR